MKTLARRWRKPFTSLLFLGVLTGLFSSGFAQVEHSRNGEETKSGLKAQIARLAQQIEAVQTEQDQLLRKNKALTDKINATKRQLQKGGNPLVELQLQNDLKASRTLADEVQALDKENHEHTQQSIALKKQLVGMLNREIEELSREANITRNAKQKARRLEQVLALQKEMEAYQEQITAESNELLLGLDITVAQTDGPEEIQQKTAIVQDQRDIIQAKIQRLGQQIRDTRMKLSLQQNMLELLRDIRRGEDDEFDLDRDLRIAESQEAIGDAETTLELLQTKLENWQVKEKSLAEKIKRFSQEVKKLKQPVQKGD